MLYFLSSLLLHLLGSCRFKLDHRDRDNQNTENFPLSPAVEKASMDVLLPAMETTDAPFMSQDTAIWQQNADWLHEMGLLSEQADVSFMVVDLLAE